MKGRVIPGANHKWNCYIGLPNCTSIWQVGDSLELNGQYKRHLRLAQNRITKEQSRSCQNLEVLKRHIVSMVMEAFPPSFGNVKKKTERQLPRGDGFC